MERDTAVGLANEWHDLVRGDEALETRYGGLTSALSTLLPDTIERGSGALVNDSPSVIACDENAVYVIGFAPTESDELEVRFARHPLTSGGSISGRDEFDGERMAHIRHWRFTWPSGVELAFSSVTGRHDGWNTGPDSADGVARYMARALGWDIPAAGKVR